jgi:arylsulfatase A-like enzyme
MATTERPNIVFITAEQQRGDTVHCDGADWMTTPNQDALAADGRHSRNEEAPAGMIMNS